MAAWAANVPAKTEVSVERAESALIAAAREGSERAIAELVERYAPRLLRFGAKLCDNQEDAREVMQDTLLAAARGLRSFRGESQLATWLFSIARSFCIQRQARFTSPKLLRAAERAAEALPSEELVGLSLQAALERAIAHLEPSQREVLVLRDVEGLTAAEVARVLGVSVDLVKCRLHRARLVLRERLALLLGPDEPRVSGPTCPDVVQLLSRQWEGDMPADACRSIEAHLTVCRRCNARCCSLRGLLAACGAVPTPDIPLELRVHVLGQMRRALGACGPALG